MQLTKIRYFQIKRDLGYWIVPIAVLAFGISNYVVGYNTKQNLIFATLIFFAFLTHHNKRRDLNFINRYFQSPVYDQLLNYNLSLLPLSLGFIYNRQWPLALALHFGVSLLSRFSYKSHSLKLTYITKFIPAGQFEWKAGIRTNFVLIFVLGFIAIALSPVKLFAMLALFLLNFIFIGFYGFFEPRIMLNPEGLNLKLFLKHKVSFLIKAVLITNTPLLIINSVFNADAAWFNLFFLAGFIVLASGSIYIKYAGYQPNSNPGFSMDALILTITVLIPFLLPLALYINYSTRKKALQNLLNYQDDHS